MTAFALMLCDHGLMLVWLTDWQVSEDRLLIRVGDDVDWTLYEADRNWMSRLFAGRLSIDWQFDTYGDAVEQPSRRVHGTVTEIQSTRCRQVSTGEGREPALGQAHLAPVEDTSGSWVREALPVESETSRGTHKVLYTFGYFGSATVDDELDPLYGYVLSLELT
jgi:hypothetical protein